ncbi:PIN/TRAM domain-containing protein [Candidatus Oscillochloris fontis]|uniref:PIN/TRAM domain-containing protein n=1 Tax=Candidatus Oscillochloris fontis TaxID=2496868 RepID=UPI00101B6295|nr:PIN domain-containing protein [Candidatus Oscillochloris fontis]
MKVSLNFLVRIAGMLVLAYVGWAVGGSLSSARPDDLQLVATQLLMLSGAGLGLLITPRLTIEPIQDLINHSRSIPLSELFLVGFGSIIGLFFAVLLTVPLTALPPPFSTYLPIIAAGVGAYVGVTIFATRKRDIIESMRNWRRSSPSLTLSSTESAGSAHRYILDTSTIIDGRIAAVVQTGFLDGTLIVPGFVLAELQQLADSNDELRRSKGRRGLELLNTMQKQSPLPIEVINVEVAGTNKVDDKLVAMARQYNCPVITNDFNLNRVASLQGVKVLSLNQLSEAVRPPVVQDQRLHVLIRNEGNARQQGVGYLDDGTPVIVEDARHLIGKTIEVSVIRLHQTQTGRLVFAQLIEGE